MSNSGRRTRRLSQGTWIFWEPQAFPWSDESETSEMEAEESGAETVTVALARELVAGAGVVDVGAAEEPLRTGQESRECLAPQ